MRPIIAAGPHARRYKHNLNTQPPIIGITCDLDADGRTIAGATCASAVRNAGGLPVFLPVDPDLAIDFATCLDGFIFTGGDDPIMEQWGVPTHPNARKIHPQRQAFELALLDALRDQPSGADKPVLGICLGMQLMGLHAGATLEQHLPDSLPTHSLHWGKAPGVAHPIEGELGAGVVLSHHRQALTDAGSMRIIARAPDGVIEAIDDPSRRFCVGVQWHPERTADDALGLNLFRLLIEAAFSCPPALATGGRGPGGGSNRPSCVAG